MRNEKALADIIKTMEKTDGRYLPPLTSFTAFKLLVDAAEVDGFVVFDVGGDLHDWIEGLSRSLLNSGVALSKDPDEIWWGAFELVGEDERHDLALVFKDDGAAFHEMQLFNNWRADKPKNCLISQYLVRCAPAFYKD